MQHRRRVLHLGTNMKKKWRVGTVEQKLLFTLFFIVIFGVVSLGFFAEGLAEADKMANTTEQYFACEAPGSTSGACSKYVNEVDKYDFNTLGAVTYTLVGLLPLAILIFVIDWSTTWNNFNNFLLNRRPHPSHNHGNQVFSTFSPAPITSINDGGQN